MKLLSPNHALQRTAPVVTAPAPRRPTAQEPRRPPQSLSLGVVRPQGTINVNTPHLVNAVQHSELYPQFELLPHTDRASLQIGDVAKVCIRFDGHPEYSGERFWVLIRKSYKGIYSGTVDNRLEHTEHHGFKEGDEIGFDHRHIYDFVRGPFPDASPA